ncbi:MAG: hypothetical protein L0215_00480 [Gemmataceae bacterium]|nr:hypothetical protein [Gemmataceae bacterium]
MLARNVHRLFVVGKDRVLVVVSSALDILRRLQKDEAVLPLFPRPPLRGFFALALQPAVLSAAAGLRS